MTKGRKLRLAQIARAKEVLQGFPEKDDSITKEEGVLLLEKDFRKMLKKGYSPKEISSILRNEGIMIPAYLVKKFLTPGLQKPDPAARKPTPEKKNVYKTSNAHETDNPACKPGELKSEKPGIES